MVCFGNYLYLIRRSSVYNHRLWARRAGGGGVSWLSWVLNVWIRRLLHWFKVQQRCRPFPQLGSPWYSALGLSDCFADCEKVTFLLDGIKCDMLGSVISVVSGGAVHADFESARLILAEHIRMLTERSKFSNRNVLAKYVARGNWPRRGDCGRGGRSGSGAKGFETRGLHLSYLLMFLQVLKIFG